MLWISLFWKTFLIDLIRLSTIAWMCIEEYHHIVLKFLVEHIVAVHVTSCEFNLMVKVI